MLDRTFTITLTSPCPESVRIDLPDNITITDPTVSRMLWALLAQAAAAGVLASDSTTRPHTHAYESGGDCGVRVCLDCGDHEGLVRCFCGWAASGADGYQELLDLGETIEPRNDAALFELGRTVMTANLQHTLTEALPDTWDAEIKGMIDRHVTGDWGDLDPEDKASNDTALGAEYQGRIFSAYHTSDGTKVWVITEGGRSYTTVLLPEDY